jgi:hypothetical protein
MNNELVDVAKHIGRVGPRINEVARLSRQYKESVRYRYRKFFVKKGITIQATPNYLKLGFARVVIFAKLTPEFESRATDIFIMMSEICYLRGFTRTLLEHEYIIHVAVPKRLKEECASVFRGFCELGLFAECKVLEFEEMKNPPMKAEFYNFTTETWKFQWPKTYDDKPTFIPKMREQVEKYDRFDLLILKELEIDANRNLVQMAERVNAPFRTLQFHYLNHVKQRNLVRAYKLNWLGTRYDFELGKPLTKKDRYVEVTVLLEGCTQTENAELRTLLNRIPFLWSEAVEPNYWAELFVPNDLYIGFLEYIEDFAGRVGEKLRVLVMDQDRALRFTIPYKLFDADTKSWRLDRIGVNKKLKNLLNGTLGASTETVLAHSRQAKSPTISVQSER